MKIFAIETSCDETAAAVVEVDSENKTNELIDNNKPNSHIQVLSSIVSSQVERHAVFGGVVPEIASRLHCETISQITKQALTEAKLTFNDIDAIAVTYTPGLIGALLVGVNYAKGLSLVTGKPLIPVHHIKAHIAANYIAHSDLKPPFLALVVSGGHSHIIAVEDYTKFKTIGMTRDDAAGEAFDKVARTLGLGYPGGPAIDKISKQGKIETYKLPTPKLTLTSDGKGKYDFSFSGLKTAVINTVHNCKQKDLEVNTADLAASFQNTVCEILCEKFILAARDYNYKNIVLAGGVSANSQLRTKMSEKAKEADMNLYYPPLSLCCDNAAMIGVQGYYEYLTGNVAEMNLNAQASGTVDN